MAWSWLDDIVPVYPLYPLLFAHSGVSGGGISALFVIWSTVGLLAQVPTGVLADRFSRRQVLVASGVLKAACYGLWTAAPGFAAFAAGFALWAVGGALAAGALEALVYDGLSESGARDRYATVLSRVRVAGLLAQLPTALAALALFHTGGYPLVGWASVASCLAAAALARLLPDLRPTSGEPDTAVDDEPSYLDLLRGGIRGLAASAALRRAATVAAVVGGLDAVEEYFPLLTRQRHIPVALVPLADVAMPLAGAAGAWLAARAESRAARTVGAATMASAAALYLADLTNRPAGFLLLAACYGVYRYALLAAETRMQHLITGPARATVTSVAELGVDLACYPVYAAWALGEGTGLAAAWLGAAVLVCCLRARR